MTDPRLLERPWFRRCTADAGLLLALADWPVWVCDGPEFRHHYDLGVTLYVHQGAARLTFADGSTAALQPGDTLTIRQGASAIWAITAPIRNSYRETA